ncbi:hypothetical protein ACJVC5_07025 [Peredibacter sp. HCB2-198]|uniref:hypothetical protein n=1 Tax=Peredibacter sp. HCB2-198 TaxID=3383025 RepID=UPI0038B61F2E
MNKKILTTVTLLSTGLANAATLQGFDATVYGFIKASAIYSTEAVGSFNNTNMSAPTHALVDTGANRESRLSFQTAQSRIGAILKKGENLSGKIELDFVDFAKSSPTTQMNPRVRIAAVTYSWGNNKVIVGQDWDLFSPVTGYTFDIVGMYFKAGNSGFMRQQAQYLKTIGDWELGGAVGLSAANPSVSDVDTEYGKAPTYALRLTRKLEAGRVGLSGIYGRIDLYNPNATSSSNPSPLNPNGRHHESYGANFFFEKNIGLLGLKAEAYYGQNMDNLGTLTLSRAVNGVDVKEYGGFLSAQYQVIEKNFVFGGVGISKIDNPADMQNAEVATTPATPPSNLLSSNSVLRIGWEYRVTEDFSWISELSRFATDTKVTDNNYNYAAADVIETGVQLRF